MFRAIIVPMKRGKWSEAWFQPVRACFDLTLQERRFLLGLLLLFCLGLTARWLAQRGAPDLPVDLPPPSLETNP